MSAAIPGESLTIRFWGVRGTIATPGPSTQRYGGNTACVEVRCGEHIVIFDAGTGIRKLGDMLLAENGENNIDILFSHFHLDHVIGIPFFSPFYKEGRSIRLWAGNLHPGHSLEAVARSIMRHPLFPIGIDAFRADVEFRDFAADAVLTLSDDIRVPTAKLNHPGGATGYRLEFAGRSVAYVTDTEHVPGKLDPAVLALADGADLLIYDCTYTEEEYAKFVGWGHSTWEQGVRLAEAASSKRLAIFHHDPDHEDGFMDRVQLAAEKARPGTLVAREGLELQL